MRDCIFGVFFYFLLTLAAQYLEGTVLEQNMSELFTRLETLYTNNLDLAIEKLFTPYNDTNIILEQEILDFKENSCQFVNGDFGDNMMQSIVQSAETKVTN